MTALFSRRGVGLLIILLSAASFGAVAPFARQAYDSGVNAATLMAVRYALAGLAVLGFLAWRRQPCQLRGQQLWLTLGLALFLGVTSFAYLESIRYIPVSLAALIYYTYPIPGSHRPSRYPPRSGYSSYDWRRHGAQFQFGGLDPPSGKYR